MKDAIRSIVIVSGVWLLAACGQAPIANTDLTSESESEELTGVRNCLSLGHACMADAATAADLALCQQQVRACFAGVVHDDGGLRPGCDAAPRDSHDAALPPVDSRDAGPRVVVDGGRRAAIEACISALRDCLTSGTDPMTCGHDARSCLEQVFH
jgi:hypothetical protein